MRVACGTRRSNKSGAGAGERRIAGSGAGKIGAAPAEKLGDLVLLYNGAENPINSTRVRETGKLGGVIASRRGEYENARRVARVGHAAHGR